MLPSDKARERILQAIHDERRRQILVEGWSLEHDDGHDKGEMARAAAAYAWGAGLADDNIRAWLVTAEKTPRRDNGSYWLEMLRRLWPWDFSWWKPQDRRRDLVRAGALIVAEIERLDRAIPPPPQEAFDAA